VGEPVLRAVEKTEGGPFALPALPFSEDALAPHISAQTLKFHHGKHHKGYVDKLNKLVAGTPYAEMELVEVVRQTCADDAKKPIFNNAAQAWNHTFYWNSLSGKQTSMDNNLAAAVERDFGSTEALNQLLVKVATEHFASGWAWLVRNGGKLEVMDTHDADTPIARNIQCLLTIDVWEHAYYVDRRNDRKAYVEAVARNLLNWDFASKNFAKSERT
jgi:Fe-Mn family superoxide dismutase